MGITAPRGYGLKRFQLQRGARARPSPRDDPAEPELGLQQPLRDGDRPRLQAWGPCWTTARRRSGRSPACRQRRRLARPSVIVDLARRRPLIRSVTGERDARSGPCGRRFTRSCAASRIDTLQRAGRRRGLHARAIYSARSTRARQTRSRRVAPRPVRARPDPCARSTCRTRRRPTCAWSALENQCTGGPDYAGRAGQRSGQPDRLRNRVRRGHGAPRRRARGPLDRHAVAPGRQSGAPSPTGAASGRRGRARRWAASRLPESARARRRSRSARRRRSPPSSAARAR